MINFLFEYHYKRIVNGCHGDDCLRKCDAVSWNQVANQGSYEK